MADSLAETCRRGVRQFYSLELPFGLIFNKGSAIDTLSSTKDAVVSEARRLQERVTELFDGVRQLLMVPDTDTGDAQGRADAL